MKKTITILVGIILSLSIFGQVNQPGKVYEYNLENSKTALSGVNLEVWNAPTTVSNKKGNFVLEFRTLHPGDRVSIRRIEKEGYEIFNKEALEQWYISSDGSEFKIIMCSSKKFRQLRDDYTKKTSSNYEKQYQMEQQKLQEQLEEGKIVKVEYENKLRKLANELDQKLSNLDNYVDRFARIDLTQLSAEERQIIELVKQGNFDEAVARYNDIALLQKLQQEKADALAIGDAIQGLQKAQIKKNASIQQVKEALLRQINLLLMVGGEENYNMVDTIYRNLVDTIHPDMSIVLRYCAFLQDLNLNSQAVLSLLGSLHQENMIPAQMETYWNILSSTYLALGNYTESIRCAERAEKIGRESTLGRGELIEACHYVNRFTNLALPMSLSVKYLNEIDTIHQNILRKLDVIHELDSVVWKRFRYEYTIHFGTILCRTPHLDEAMALLHEGEKMIQDSAIISHEIPYLYLNYCLQLYQNLSYMYLNIPNYLNLDSAIIYGEKQMDLLHEYASKGMLHLDAGLGDAASSLATCYFYKGDTTAALNYATTAAKAQRNVYRNHQILPENYSMALSNLGYLMLLQGNFKEADSLLYEALDVIEPYYQYAKDAYFERYYYAAANYGYSFLLKHDYAQSVTLLDNAIQCIREYFDHVPYLAESYSTVLGWRAQCALGLKENETAIYYLKEALRINPNNQEALMIWNQMKQK